MQLELLSPAPYSVVAIRDFSPRGALAFRAPFPCGVLALCALLFRTALALRA